MKVVVASGNPVKSGATREGFSLAFPDSSIELATVSVPSGVPAQPMNDAETLLGADNRSAAAQSVFPDADYWVGIEGGIEDGPDDMMTFAWVVIRSALPPRYGRSRTATLPLPADLAALVRAGHELGKADDLLYGRTNSKEHDGAVGILTNGVIDRLGFYAPSVVLALVPFLARPQPG